jgi:hypothetical protein
MSAVTSRSGGSSRDMRFLWSVSVPRLCKWENYFGSRKSQFSVGDSHGKFAFGEELEVNLWRLNVFCSAMILQVCDLVRIW